MDYEDPIISHFKDKQSIDKETLEKLIEEQNPSLNDDSSVTNKGQKEENLKHCREMLSLYTDLIKLKFLLKKSWDLQAMSKSVMVRFDIQGVSVTANEVSTTDTEDFYKDIALKTIQKCDKLSKALEQLSKDSNNILPYIQNTTSNNVSAYLQDSMCLLLEMWFLCGRVLRDLKRQVAGLFMRGKLLLIDYELDVIRTTATQVNTPDYDVLTETITSYKSFIKVLLQQLQDSEVSQDQGLFEECLGVFLDVEGMYSALNFNWLLRENKSLQEGSVRSPEEPADYDEKEEANSLKEIGEFVDNVVNADSEEEDSITPLQDISDSCNSRRLSTTSSTSDISLMMEKTSLSRELPNLLQAFNNAKKLERELENIRLGESISREITPLGSPMTSSMIAYESTPPPSLSASTTFKMGSNSPSSSMLLSSMLKPHDGNCETKNSSTHNSMILETLATKHQEFASAPIGSLSPLVASPLSQLGNSSQLIKNDILKMMSHQGTTNIPTTKRVHGFGNNVLNNLYGLGNRN